MPNLFRKQIAYPYDGELVHKITGRYSQKKKDQKENQEPSPVVNKPALP